MDFLVTVGLVFVLSFHSIAAATLYKRHPAAAKSLIDSLTGERDWLFFRSAASVALAAATVVCVMNGQYLIAGMVITATGVVRLLTPRATRHTWGWDRLRLHIVSEVFFHCLAILGLAGGIASLAVGLFPDLENAPRLTISLTLIASGVVAVNKSTARTRRLCSEIVKQSSAVTREFALLHAFHEAGVSVPQLADVQAKCQDSIDALNRALDTRLNTGYRLIGTPFLPGTTHMRFIAELRVAARSAAPSAPAWLLAEPKLRRLRRACAQWTDLMA